MPNTKEKVYRKYTEEDLRKAVEAVKGGTSCLAAAKQFKIPRITLMYKVNGKYSLDCKSGVSTILTSAEEGLIKTWLIKSARAGFPITKDHLLNSVAMLVKKLQRSNNFKNGRPGRHWYEGFLQRHPEISQRITENLTSSRAAVTEKSIRNWFREIQEYFCSRNINIDDPRRIFNADETAFFLAPKGKKVLARKGSKTVYTYTNASDKECITTLITGNAAGQLAPPLIMYSYERIPKSIVLKCPDPTWGLGKSESGWMTSESFFQYVTSRFHPWILQENIPLPVVLYVDGHKSHLTYNLSEFCSENGIILISLLPNSTHILQPMDVGVFHPLKNRWKTEVYNWRLKNKTQVLKKEDFAPLLHNVLKQTFSEESNILQSAFRITGLCPFNVESVDFTKILRTFTDQSPSKAQHDDKDSDNNPQLTVQHLTIIESLIQKHILREFYNQKQDQIWRGDVQHTRLYDMWRDVYTKVSNNANEKFNIITLNKGSEENVENDNIDGDDGLLEAVENLKGEVANSIEALGISLAEIDNLDESIEYIEETLEAGGFKSTNTKLCEDTIQHDKDIECVSINQEQDRSKLIQEDNEKTPTKKEKDNDENKINIDSEHGKLNEKINTKDSAEDLPLLRFKSRSQVNRIPRELQREETVEEIKDMKGNKQVTVISDIIIEHCQKKTQNNKTIIALETKKTVPNNVFIPSPFKSVLFWPEQSEPKKPKRSKEKILSVCSSDQWKEYYLKKEEAKTKKEEEIRNRKRKREEKRKEIELKKKKKLTNKQEGVEIEEHGKPKADIMKRRIFTEALSPADINIDSYVIIDYEGQKFPGVVKQKNEAECKFFVRVMTLSNKNNWKWPPHPDEIWYDLNEILEIIHEPLSINSRGMYRVPEIEKYY